MIGKIYRPTDVKILKGQRGFSINHKLKSNFGGFKDFEERVFLDFDYENKTEQLKIEIEGIDIPIDFVQKRFKVEPEIIHNENEKGIKNVTFKLLDESKTVVGATTVKVGTLRKLNRPSKISTTKGYLKMAHVITSPRDLSIEELVLVEFNLVIRDGKERLELSVTCNTPVSFKLKKNTSKKSVTI